ncbi:MAG TPA: transporter [Pyrinomonadaceae bacterium]|nr:transporter [Pyrinomonadaceae bacterium]
MKEWPGTGRIQLSISLLVIFGLPIGILGQQPFLTDDTDVTEKGKFHLEIINEFDLLQRTSRPLRYQNATRATIAYGVAENVEVSVASVFLTVRSGEAPRTAAGVGDTTIAVKYNLLKEKEDSKLPAMTVSGYVQTPTGDSNRGLGSGVFDYGIIGIAQRTYRSKNVVRLNAGILFSGNTQTGALGIVAVRGRVYTGGISYVRSVNDRLQLGAELTGAVTGRFELSRGQLQPQFGGNYQIRKNTTVDFGLIVGRFAASPRAGLQIGFSHDF